MKAREYVVRWYGPRRSSPLLLLTVLPLRREVRGSSFGRHDSL